MAKLNNCYIWTYGPNPEGLQHLSEHHQSAETFLNTTQIPSDTPRESPETTYMYVFSDAIASPVSQWVSEVSDLEIAIASPSFASLFL